MIRGFAPKIVARQGARYASKGRTEHLYVFTAPKGGMDGYDKNLQKKVIEELTKGSPHFKKAVENDKKIDKKVKTMQKKVKSLTNTDKAKSRTAADKLMKEFELERKKGEWCAVIDMDMFYAAVETRDDPSLAKIPMVVGKGSMVTTANYIARKYGVRSAMPGFIARELASRQGATLTFVKPDMKKYKEVSKIINGILKKYTKSLHHVSLDEAYLNITNKVTGNTEKQRQISAESVLKKMRQDIFKKTGLTASGGLGPNMMLAKLAADVHKPNGQFTTPIKPADIQKWLGVKSVRSIPGVGKVTERILSEGLNIKTVNDVIRKRAVLFCIMGIDKKTPQALLRSAMGISRTVYSEAPAKSIGAERSYNHLHGQVSQLRALHGVCREALSRLEPEHTPVGFNLRIKTEDFAATSRKVDIKGRGKVTLKKISSLAEKSFLSDYPTQSVRLLGVRFILK
eukprot:TRINITY_DN28481_c0_g1_i1.p1 TRINITY_DN28481_c0_g1~~TRINITY_DN28481_c0_g1_i1.p1  ORF type:complete len:473 (+),score=76.61 TRINITY_DN28481_c0_g1_i1:54-1421(+)